MPRKGPAPKRPLIADPVYGSPVVTQLINKVLFDGKKTVAESIVYGALEGVRDKTDSDPVVILKRALENIRPALEVRSRRGWCHLPGASRSSPSTCDHTRIALVG